MARHGPPRATPPRGVSLTKIGESANWHKVAENSGYTRYVADYMGYMIEAWGYTDGPDKGNYYWRVSHAAISLAIVGHEYSRSSARGRAVATVLELVGVPPDV